ncbi:MAG: F0F1 ATP synthase subunit epsilon [Bacteroidales bacterium]|nr:F0F1 ATP synthase subunit epsilon [Bacteroidales bacterium]HPD95912.1 F0F1 ATP synthase subunit epsilon [Tenuifilaceae bacterium]HRX32184.1 F0F1 ATP synthase subunit epsilon [Tenuifilaceae bacterium]
MICQLVSPEKNFQLDDVYYVQVPGTKGSFGVLQKHAPLASTLEPGIIKVVQTQGGELLFNIPQGGFIKILDDTVTIITEEVEQTF